MLSKVGANFNGVLWRHCITVSVNHFASHVIASNSISLRSNFDEEFAPNAASSFNRNKSKNSNVRRLYDYRLTLLNKLMHSSPSIPHVKDSIVDFISAVDSNTPVRSYDLDNLLKLFSENSLDLSKFTDHQKASLIKATGKICKELLASKRVQYMNEVIKVLSSNDGNWEIETLNAYINAQIDNNMKLNAVIILKEFEKHNIEPNARTYELLSENCAKNADLNTLLNLINHMKEIRQSLSRTTLNNLIYALAFAGQDDQAISIIESYANNNSLSRWFKLTYAIAKARKADVEKAINMVESVGLSKADWKIAMDLLVAFVEVNREEGVQKVLSMIPYLANDGKMNTGSTILYTIDYILDALSTKENLLSALRLADFLPDFHSRLLSGDIKFFLRDLDINDFGVISKVNEAFSLHKFLIDGAIDPLRFLMDRASIERNVKSFEKLYELYTKTEEYKQFNGRSTLTLPRICWKLTELENLDKQDRTKVFIEVAKEISKINTADFDIVDSCFIKPLQRDEEVLIDVLHNIDISCSFFNYIIKQVVYNLAINENMAKLERLLQGSHGVAIFESSGINEALLQLFLSRNLSSKQKIFMKNTILSKFANKSTRDSMLELVHKTIETERFHESNLELLNELEFMLSNEGSSRPTRKTDNWKKNISEWMNEKDVKVLENMMKNAISDEKALILHAILFEKALSNKICADEVKCLYDSINVLLKKVSAPVPKQMRRVLTADKSDCAEYRNWSVMIKLAYCSWLCSIDERDQAREILVALNSNLNDIIIEMSNKFVYSPLCEANNAFISLFVEEFAKKDALKRPMRNFLTTVHGVLMKRGDLVEAASFLRNSKLNSSSEELKLLDAVYQCSKIEDLKKVYGLLISDGNSKRIHLTLAYVLLKNSKIDLAFDLYEAKGLPLDIILHHVQRLLQNKEDHLAFSLLKKVICSEDKPEPLIKIIALELIDYYKNAKRKDLLKLLENELQSSSVKIGDSVFLYLQSSLAA